MNNKYTPNPTEHNPVQESNLQRFTSRNPLDERFIVQSIRKPIVVPAVFV